MIPGVAASGTGGAQTGVRARRGSDCASDWRSQPNGPGKAGHRG